MSIQREKIKMVAGVPLTFVLEDAVGKPMTSRFHTGTEYLYSVNHRGAACLLYLPVEGAQALNQLGARSGDEVQLTKAQTQGQAPTFVARFVSDAPQPALPARGALPTSQDGGIRMLAPQSQFAPQAAPPPSPAGLQHVSAVAQVHPLEDVMRRCFVVAGRALWNAHADLLASGCAYDAPTIEDARAAGISMFIERTRGGR